MVARVRGTGRGMIVTITWQHTGPCSDETVLYLDHDGGYANLHVI